MGVVSGIFVRALLGNRAAIAAENLRPPCATTPYVLRVSKLIRLQ